MSKYLYLSLIPESLIASMLPPEEFGNYYATGRHSRSRGQALFFEVDASKLDGGFDLSLMETRCVPHADGTPRRSTYIAVYRVLERIPLEALGRLYVTTNDGKTIGLEAASFEEEAEGQVHLYQEICPMRPRVASSLPPREFCARVTDPAQPVHVPKLAFAELILRQLKTDPQAEDPGELPYSNLEHLRDCLDAVRHDPEKKTKLAMRQMKGELLYRTVRNGFFVGGGDEFRYYPLPNRDQLENEHRSWWRSALETFGE
jgi:hypothetical protein